MKNYLQAGDMITFTAAAALTSGAGVLVGNLFGIVANTVANGESGEMKTTGVFSVTKATGAAWAIGDKIYWDDTAKNFTKTVGSNKYVGVAVSVQASGDTTGDVRLNGTGTA